MPNPPNKKRRGLLDVAKENAALKALHQQNYLSGLRGGPESDSQVLTHPIRSFVGKRPQYGIDEGGQRVTLRPGKGLLGGFANLEDVNPAELTELGDVKAVKDAAVNAIAKIFGGKADMSWPQIGMLGLSALPFVTGGGSARPAIRSAIELPDGRVFRAPDTMPNHFGAWELAASELGMPLDELLNMPGVVEGYEDAGKFLDRAQGLQRAKELEQLNPDNYSSGLGKLDSEDLLFAKGGSLGGLFRLTTPYFDRSAPRIEGTIRTPEGLIIPEAQRAKPSLLAQAIMDNPDPVRRVLDADVERRLRAGEQFPGDEPWYETGAMKQAFDAEGGPGTFDNWAVLGGIASQQNSVPMQNAITTVLNHAMKFGRSHADALDEYHRVTGDKLGLNTPADQLDRAYTMVGNGLLTSTNPLGANWKTPSYSMLTRGGGSVDDEIGKFLVALDTHERKQILNAVLSDPALAAVANTPYLKSRGGLLVSPVERAAKNKGQIPIQNAQDYRALTESLYLPGAQKFGLPTGGAYQALRWEGGAGKTGVRSPLGRSYQQITEDQMAETLLARGLEPTVKNMDGLLKSVIKGEDFLIMPGSWRKKFPLADFLDY